MIFSRKLIHPVRELAESGKLTGILLISATLLSLIISNSDYGSTYIDLWNKEVGISFLHKSVLHWINDGLMAIFFLLVGLEIKRELIQGELSTLKKAFLPVFAAAGGIVLPAMIFIMMNWTHPESLRGWAIPTATDIAFSLGILSLIGKRVSFKLKIFLTALAIIDDLGAIVIIAFFYSQGINYLMLLYAGLTLAFLFIINHLRVRNILFFLLPGTVLWYFILKSGIHPTIAGVMLAFTIPMDLLNDLEHQLNKPVNYFILPLFAFANTAMPVTMGESGDLVTPLSLGIIAGLLIGKPMGITIAAFIAVKFRLAILPHGIRWTHLAGLGFIAGIGFTMSIFISSLSFEQGLTLILSKFSILTASFLSAVAGIIWLYRTLPKQQWIG
jgi:Na+:H+ antiporter, NhaA family